MSNVSHSASGKSDISVPEGHILVSHTWQSTQLTTHLAALAKIAYSESLGVVDFYPSEQVAVLFISQADLIAGNSYRRKVVRFRQICSQGRGVVMAQKNPFTTDQFPSFQKFVCIELGLSVIPVRSIEEAAELLSVMAKCESKFNSNPFRIKLKQMQSPDQLILSNLTEIPGLGEKRALMLLEKFKSLEGICNASEKMIAEVVGSG